MRDITYEKIDLKGNQIKFEGKSDGKTYGFDFELFDEIVPEESKWNKTGFHLLFVLEKKDMEIAFWPRITKNK